jgi:hypothetical protein
MKPSAPAFWGQCNWRIRESNGAVALLNIKPTTLESRIKKLGLVSQAVTPNFRRLSEFSENFERSWRAVARVRLSLPHCSIGYFIWNERCLSRWPASCEVNQEACPGPSGGDQKNDYWSPSQCRLWPIRNLRRTVMKHVIIPLLLAAGFIASTTMEANAVVCARGVYRAGCVAAGGAAVVARPVVRPVARAVVVAPRGVAVRRRVY